MSRRFEFEEGNSKKFWAGEVDGKTLNVQWGRIGTAGQAQTKTFPSPALAEKELEKLIREKTKKGYREVRATKTSAKAIAKPSASVKAADTKTSAAAKEAPPAKAAAEGRSAKSSKASLPPRSMRPRPAPSETAVDESTLTIPTAWRRRVHPRKGAPSATFTTTKVDGSGAKKALFAHYNALRKKLVAGASQAVADGALMKKVDERVSKDLPPSDPRVEGALGAIARFRTDFYGKPKGEAAIDHWVATKGVAFAADAMLHSIGFGMGIKPRSAWESSPWFALSGITNEKNAKSFDAPGFVSHANDARLMLLRLRRLLAESSDADYAAAREVAGKHRKKSAYVERVVAAYLFPTERAWVEEDIADYRSKSRSSNSSELRCWRPEHVVLLVTTLSRREDYLAINGVKTLPERAYNLAIPHVMEKEAHASYLATLLEGMGADVLPLLCYWHDKRAPHREIAQAMAAIPTDEAFTALLDRADDKHALAGLVEAVAAFPKRATRLIAERVAAKGKNWKAVASLAPSTTASSSNATRAAVPEAASANVPSVLVTPPWSATTQTNGAAPSKPIGNVAMLPYERSVRWVPGEKETFATKTFDTTTYREWFREKLDDYKKRAPSIARAEWQKLLADTGENPLIALCWGPKDLSLAYLARWQKEDEGKYACHFLQEAIGAHELDAFDLALSQAKTHAKELEVLEAIAPIDAAELAPHVAGVTHLKKLKAAAEGWLLRHPKAAATGLIPASVGPAGDAKKAAAAGLQLLARSGHAQAIRDAARAYGAEVSAAIEATMGSDPRLAKQPKAPTFWSPAKLPPIVLLEGGSLPKEAVENLRVMLALNELDHPFPGLADALTACDRDSLAAFGWAVFEAWQRAGFPAAEKWALASLGVLGNDDVVRKLTPLVRAWPGESSHARAVIGLDVLGAIGSDLALSSIQGIAERIKFEALQELAKKHIASVAKRRNLSVEELEDRLVPTLDLDANGTTALELGGRTFTVGFDETLTPFVRDADGKRLPNGLPKPNAKDEAGVAAQAKFAALKKDVRAIGPNQLRRLERSMIAERRWSASDFETFFVRHPLLGHIVKTLVWGVYEKEKLASTFRVAEDRTLASIDDKPLALRAGQTLGIVHPLRLDEKTLERWGKVFSEYEVLQPFAQLGRGCYGHGDVAELLRTVPGRTLPTGKVLGLTNLGWKRGAPQDSGYVGWMTRDSSIGVLHLELEQGYIAGAVNEYPQQTLGKLTVGRESDRVLDAAALRRLGEIEASELAHSLGMIVG